MASPLLAVLAVVLFIVAARNGWRAWGRRRQAARRIESAGGKTDLIYK